MLLEIQFSIDQASEHWKSRGRHLEAELFEECQRRWPGFFDPKNKPRYAGDAMWVQGRQDDPEVREVMRFLEEHGRQPWWQRFPVVASDSPTHYQVRGVRTPTKEDFAQAEYFTFHCQKAISRLGGYREGTDVLEIHRGEITRQSIGQILGLGEQLCTDALRQEMESGQFAGLTFREVLGANGKTIAPPYWQLWSDRLMPALLNRVVNEQDGAVFDPQNPTRGCRIDDLYIPRCCALRRRKSAPSILSTPP